MSGGHFEYKQFMLEDVADEIDEMIINNGSDELDAWGYKAHANYSAETIEEFKKAVHHIRMAKLYMHRIDWLVSGDDGEDAFHTRLNEGKQLLETPNGDV